MKLSRLLLLPFAVLLVAGCGLLTPISHNQAANVAEKEIVERDPALRELPDRNRLLRESNEGAIMSAPPRTGAGLVGEINIGKMAAGESATSRRGKGSPVSLDFTDANLKDIVVIFLQDYLKQPYTFQDSFRDRKVNLYFNATATRQELIQLFDTLLDNYGVRLRYAGGVYLVGSIDEKGSKESTEKPALPSMPSPIGIGDAVGVFRPYFIEARDLQTLAKQVMKQPDRMTLAGTALVVNSSSVDVRAVDSLMGDVDVPAFANKHILVYVPRYLSASSLAAVMESYQAQLSSGQATASKQFEAKQITDSDRIVIVAANSLARDLVVQFLAQADVAGANQRRVFQYALGTQVAEDLKKNLDPLLKSIFRSSTELAVVADKASNSLFIYATPDEFAEIRKLLARMDFRPPAVAIDMAIAEVDLTENMKYGVEWYLKKTGSWLADVTTKLGVNAAATTGMIAAAISPNNTYATLQLIGNETSFSLLSSPKIVVKNGATAKINVGREQPVIKSKTQNNAAAGANTTIEPEFKKIGLELEVTPFITQANEVRMIIKLKDTSIVGYELLGSDRYPVLANRELSTDLVTGDGTTVFLGGIRKQETTDLSEKLPGFGDLKYIGALFRNKDMTDNGQELIILATPTIIMDQQGADLITRALLKASRRPFTDPRPPQAADTPAAAQPDAAGS